MSLADGSREVPDDIRGVALLDLDNGSRGVVEDVVASLDNGARGVLEDVVASLEDGSRGMVKDVVASLGNGARGVVEDSTGGVELADDAALLANDAGVVVLLADSGGGAFLASADTM